MTMNKQTWKQVSISGVTGILMGAGAMKAVQSMAAGEVENNAEQAENASPYDNMSFREAFGIARAELGAGGVFRWHGNIYNTYTIDEWNAMKAEEQDEFAEQVGVEIIAGDVDTSDLADAEQIIDTEDDSDVSIVPNDSVNANEPAVSEHVAETAEAADDDVRVLGYGDVALENGRTITVEELNINGQRVAVIDVDKDGEADLALSDLNQNRQMDEGEVIDLHTGEAVSFTNDNDNVEYTADSLDI